MSRTSALIAVFCCSSLSAWCDRCSAWSASQRDATPPEDAAVAAPAAVAAAATDALGAWRENVFAAGAALGGGGGGLDLGGGGLGFAAGGGGLGFAAGGAGAAAGGAAAAGAPTSRSKRIVTGRPTSAMTARTPS